MKKSLLRVTALLSVLVMTLSLFASCADADDAENDGTGEVTTTVGGDTENEFDANGYLKDSLPESTDYDDRDFIIYAWEEQKMWEWVETEEYSASLVDQALYKRQLNVEERFGINFDWIFAKGNWDNRNTFVQTLSNSVNANDHAFDLVSQYTAAAGAAATQGLYHDLGETEHLDFEKPWWPNHIVDTATIGGKLYFATGDITALLIRNVQCMFVNTDLFNSYEMNEQMDGRTIYQIVKDYDWTLENLKKMAIGKVDSSEISAIATNTSSTADAFLYGGGFIMIEDKDGIPALSDDLGDGRFITWFDSVKTLYNSQHEDVKNNTGNKPFEQKEAVFYCGDLGASQQFAQAGVQFTVLPMPMFDKDQGEYYTCGSLWVSMYSIPLDVSDRALSGLIMEGLASEAYRTVTDEIYYNLFQMRYNSSGAQDSAEMFDIVSDSVVFDVSRMFADDLKVFAVFRNGVTDPQGNWSTIYGGSNGEWKANLTALWAKMAG